MVHSLRFNFMNVVSGVINYLNEVRGEMAKVTWPAREKTIKIVGLIIIISIVMGVFIGGLDFLLSRLLNIILQR